MAPSATNDLIQDAKMRPKFESSTLDINEVKIVDFKTYGTSLQPKSVPRSIVKADHAHQISASQQASTPPAPTP